MVGRKKKQPGPGRPKGRKCFDRRRGQPLTKRRLEDLRSIIVSVDAYKRTKERVCSFEESQNKTDKENVDEMTHKEDMPTEQEIEEFLRKIKAKYLTKNEVTGKTPAEEDGEELFEALKGPEEDKAQDLAAKLVHSE